MASSFFHLFMFVSFHQNNWSLVFKYNCSIVCIYLNTEQNIVVSLTIIHSKRAYFPPGCILFANRNNKEMMRTTRSKRIQRKNNKQQSMEKNEKPRTYDAFMQSIRPQSYTPVFSTQNLDVFPSLFRLETKMSKMLSLYMSFYSAHFLKWICHISGHKMNY